MSNTIQIKRSSTAAAVPTAGQLAVGELAVNLADRKLFTKDGGGTVVELTSPGFVINSLTTTDPALGDFIPFADISDSNNPKKATAESVVKAATNATGSAPIYACRAWVNFNGTGTVVIRASGNVSSITDNGVGRYQINFTTAMPDVNYASSLSARYASAGSPNISGVVAESTGVYGAAVRTTAALGIVVMDTAAGAIDADFVSVAIFR